MSHIYTNKTYKFTLSIKDTDTSPIFICGNHSTFATGETGNYTTTTAISNNHVFLLINSITGSGNVTITGTSIDKNTGLPTTSDTEVISIDGSVVQYYKTVKQWWEITNIAIGSGITVINYNIGLIHALNLFQIKFELLSYHCDFLASGVNPDILLKLIRVKKGDGCKFSLLQLENIGIDSNSTGNQIIDGVRTGGDDRSYNPTVSSLWGDNTHLTFNTNDFTNYWSGENIIDGTNGEGLIIQLEGSPEPSTPTNVDIVNIFIHYRKLYT